MQLGIKARKINVGRKNISQGKKQKREKYRKKGE
jgi:hypothetical protein